MLRVIPEEAENRNAECFVATSGRALWIRSQNTNLTTCERSTALCMFLCVVLSKFLLMFLCLVAFVQTPATIQTRASERSECDRSLRVWIQVSTLCLLLLEVCWNLPSLHFFPPQIDINTGWIIPPRRRQIMFIAELLKYGFDIFLLVCGAVLMLENRECSLARFNFFVILILSLGCPLALELLAPCYS